MAITAVSYSVNVGSTPAGSSNKENKLMTPFESELETLINSYSMEEESGTPDFILARYLIDCLKAFNNATCTRAEWYHR